MLCECFLDYWDVLLLLCEFDLNSSHSDSTKQSPTIVVFSYEPNLSLENAIHNVTDSWV